VLQQLLRCDNVVKLLTMISTQSFHQIPTCLTTPNNKRTSQEVLLNWFTTYTKDT